jgi:hypothetical protein
VIGRAPAGPAATYEQVLAAVPAPAAGTLPVRPECPTITLPWREFRVGQAAVTVVARANDGRLAAGDAAGNVVLFGADGDRRAAVRFSSPILALTCWWARIAAPSPA